MLRFFFFFNDTATTEIYTLSLHDALPIFVLSTYKVVVVGAAGHVGLPLALVLAEHGNYTVGIDVNELAVNKINSGCMPFYEEGAESLLRRCLASGNLRIDRKSTRLNSSHANISYAVFCLKK